MAMLMAVTETLEQVRNRTKTVTRRKGWAHLRAGHRLILTDRSPRGAKPFRRIVQVEVVDVRREPLNAITVEDVAREGFPSRSVDQFVTWYCERFGVTPGTEVTRVEWVYAEGAL